MRPIRVFIAGDSTAADYPADRAPMAGWGQLLPVYLSDKATVVNEAQCGRSSKSFIDEGHFQRIVDAMREGDYLLIQFGHNDQKPDAERRTEPGTTYPEHLKKYVDAARAAGATPVLITPVQRRNFIDGKYFQHTHGEYPDAVRRLAAQLEVALIDLSESSEQLLVSLGPAESRKLFTWLAPGEHPNYPEGSEDNTHFNEAGAREIAGLVVEGIRRTGLGLNSYLAYGG